MKKEVKLYRYTYEWNHWTDEAEPVLNSYTPVAETPKGYWICLKPFGRIQTKDKWVPKGAIRAYAHETKAMAMHSLVKRCEKRILILERQMEITKDAKKIADKMEKKFKEEGKENE